MRYLFLIAVYPLLLTGCSAFYKIKATDGKFVNVKKLDSLKELSKVFILRTPKQAFHMRDIGVSADQQEVQFIPDTVPASHLRHVRKKKYRLPAYEKDKDSILQEVHLYSTRKLNLSYGKPAILNLDSIVHMEVLEHDKGLTAALNILAVVAAAVTVVAIAEAIDFFNNIR